MQKSSSFRTSLPYLALLVLPRHFALPVAISSMVLGFVVSAPMSWAVLLPAFLVFCVASYSHTMNTYLDYEWTKLDQGAESERSHPKPYTSGQQVIASGVLSPRQVLAIAVGWLLLSTIAMIYISIRVDSLWMVLFWTLSALVTIWYSWGKLHWMPELALGVGFAPLAAIIGAAATSTPDYLAATLASIPIFLIFGFGAEIFDQWWDADVNWERGLRNIGALAWRYHIFIWEPVSLVVLLTYFAQFVLMFNGVLSTYTLATLPALVSLPLLVFAWKRKPWAVILLLGAVFYYCVALAVGQVLGG